MYVLLNPASARMITSPMIISIVVARLITARFWKWSDRVEVIIKRPRAAKNGKPERREAWRPL